MSANYPDHYVVTFTANVQLLLQQRMSKLARTVTQGTYSGKQASVVDQVGTLTVQRNASRFGTIERVDADLYRRWVLPAHFQIPVHIDKRDVKKAKNDLHSPLVQASAAAFNREIDAEIADAFYADAVTGEEGDATTSFDTTNQVVAVNHGAAAAIGMTFIKIREAMRILLNNELDLEMAELFCIIGPQQWYDLFGETEFTNFDYTANRSIDKGMLGTPMGVTFVPYTGLSTDSSGYRECPLYDRSAMHLGTWMEIEVNADVRADLNARPDQILMEGMWGSTRTEETRIVKILCDES